MRLIFCVRDHTFDEICMGHLLGFPAIRGVDAISATANARGFTPLTAIARTFSWQRDVLEAAAAECNQRREVAVLNTLTPNLLLVPKTRGDGGWLPDVDHLLTDLIAAVNHLQVRSLHFTHFGFVQGRPPEMEMRRILELWLSPLQESTPDVLYWDVDRRALNILTNLYAVVARQYRFKCTKPEIYDAPTFTWQEIDSTPRGNSVHIFTEGRDDHFPRFH